MPSDTLRLGVVARQSFESWGRNFWQLTVLATALEVPIAIAQLLWHAEAGITVDTSRGLLPSLFSGPLAIYAVLSHHFLSGLIEKFVGAERHGHEQPTLLEIVKDLPWLRLVVADLLVALATALGVILFVIPGLVAATYLSIVLPLINLERQPIVPTFKRSVGLVRGNGRRAFVVWLTTLVVPSIVASLVAYPFHGSGSELVQVLSHSVPTAVLLPIAALPLVVMAFELVERERAISA